MIEYSTVGGVNQPTTVVFHPSFLAAWKEVARDCPPPFGLYDNDDEWTSPEGRITLEQN